MQTPVMLGPHRLAFADEIAASIRRLANDDRDKPMSVWALAFKLTGAEALPAVMRNAGELRPIEGRFSVYYRIYYRHDVSGPERTLIVGHELCHLWFALNGLAEPDYIEALCDAVSARLVAPDVLFRDAAQRWDHRVHELARRFFTTQAVALLRLCETLGRSGMVISRRGGFIARGPEFGWVPDWRAIPRSVAHYVSIDDRWGMLAQRRRNVIAHPGRRLWAVPRLWRSGQPAGHAARDPARPRAAG